MTLQKLCRMTSFAAATFVLMLAIRSAASAATTCESLAGLKLADTTITLAQSVEAGKFAAAPAGRGGGGNPYADLPAFCRVTATIKPSADSDIKMEIWLPATD